MAEKPRNRKEFDETRFFPTFYQIGGEWGFTCTWCKGYTFGYSSKAYAEDGMLDHYDCCSAFPAEWKNEPDLQLRKEVQDFGVSCNAPVGSNVRDTYGSIR